MQYKNSKILLYHIFKTINENNSLLLLRLRQVLMTRQNATPSQVLPTSSKAPRFEFNYHNLL